MQLVYDYFSTRQHKDLHYYEHQYLADERPKSPFKPSERYCRWIQTKDEQYRLSRTFQRFHYEDVSEGTKTTVTCLHWGQDVDSFETWPYYGEKDRNTGLTNRCPSLLHRKIQEAEQVYQRRRLTRLLQRFSRIFPRRRRG